MPDGIKTPVAVGESRGRQADRKSWLSRCARDNTYSLLTVNRV